MRKKVTEETRKLMSESCSSKKRVIIDGVEYDSIVDAAKRTGINWNTVRNRCLSKSDQFIEYQFKD